MSSLDDTQKLYDRIVEIIKCMPVYQVSKGHELIADTHHDAILVSDLLKAIEDQV